MCVINLNFESIFLLYFSKKWILLLNKIELLLFKSIFSKYIKQ